MRQSIAISPSVALDFLLHQLNANSFYCITIRKLCMIKYLQYCPCLINESLLLLVIPVLNGLFGLDSPFFVALLLLDFGIHVVKHAAHRFEVG